jgi:hypothetical protein
MNEMLTTRGFLLTVATGDEFDTDPPDEDLSWVVVDVQEGDVALFLAEYEPELKNTTLIRDKLSLQKLWPLFAEQLPRKLGTLYSICYKTFINQFFNMS